MATNIEIEAKALISEDDYHKVKDYFKFRIIKEYIQNNYYIDDEEYSLRKHGAGLRIRELSNNYELTLKTPIAEGLLEKTDNISKEDYINMATKNIFPEGKIKSFLAMLGYKVENFKILASLKTTRADVMIDESKFSIDKNEYSKSIDYELELEANNPQLAKNTLMELCKECNIEYKPNDISKQARALKAIEK